MSAQSTVMKEDASPKNIRSYLSVDTVKILYTTDNEFSNDAISTTNMLVKIISLCPSTTPRKRAFISLCSPSYVRSIASSKASSPQSAMWCSFNFQYPRFSLRSSGSCLCLLPRLPVTSILPSIFPSIPRFIRQDVIDVEVKRHGS